MVFCYKIITDTPRRSGNTSPRRQSPARNIPDNVPSSLSQLVGCVEYENESVLDSIPEREWRLLAAIARKKEEDVEREKLADEFRRLWEREKIERELVEAETSQQYKQYLSEKRSQERSWLEYKRLQLSAEQLVRRGQLLDCIRHKERRSRELLATREDKKAAETIDRALQEEARMVLAADRRSRHAEAQRCRKQLELAHTQQRALLARNKRTDMLNHSAKRLAICNALSSWESSVLRQEVSALEAGRRAQHALHAQLAEQRGAALAQQRERRRGRARRLAALTAQMRADLRAGRAPPAPRPPL